MIGLTLTRRCATPGWAWAAAIALLGMHVALVAWMAAEQSPNVDEPAHLAGGMALWQYGVFDIYSVNPPLVRAIAALPAFCLPHEELWGDFMTAPKPRPEFVLGSQLIESHPEQWRRFLIAGRWALIPLSMIGGSCCFLWALELFGWKAGLLALTLWCFSADVLAWSSVIGADSPAASLAIGAGYLYWRCLKRPTLRGALWAGLFLGLAQLAKMTCIILFVIWPVLWLLWQWSRKKTARSPLQWSLLAIILLIGWNVLNAGYAFEGTFTPLGEFEFFSRTLAGAEFDEKATEGANRFTGTYAGGIPVPLPKAYFAGMDLQRWDFEKGLPSYLFGKWSDHGWWYYYLVGLVLKAPLGTWGLGLLAIANAGVTGIRRRRVFRSEADRDDQKLGDVVDLTVLLLPALAVLVILSSQDGFSVHFRYALPVFPFIFVSISSVAKVIERATPGLATLAVCLTAWTISSSIHVYPHCLSHFNELAGGPMGGHRYMLGSSFSWAQNRFVLQEWLRQRPSVDSPYMQLEHSIPLDRLGLHTRGEPPKFSEVRLTTKTDAPGPVPGWHVIDVQRIYDRDGGSRYFLQLSPVATIGFSTNIYHISIDDANRLRNQLGLPELMSLNRQDIVNDLAIAQKTQRDVNVAILNVDDGTVQELGPIQSVIRREENFHQRLVSPHDVCNGGLSGCDLLIVPGGKASLHGASLGTAGRSAIREFVENGGGYVGICAGAVLAATNHDWSLGIVNVRTMSGERFVAGVGKVSAAYRGWGAVDVEIVDNGCRVFNLGTRQFRLEHTGGPIFFRANQATLPDYEVLANFTSELVLHPFQTGTMIHTPAIIASTYGYGKVVLFSAHPESDTCLVPLLAHAIRATAR